MIRVFLVDDHELVRRGIADLIEREDDLTVVGESGTARQVGPRVEATLPDVLILDVQLPDGNGVDVCRDIQASHPEIATLMLTAYDDDEAYRAAVLAGARGFVLKDIRGQNLLTNIRRVAKGEHLVDRVVRERVVEKIVAPTPVDDGPDLTLRERQVLDLIAEGLTNRQIGERLGLAEKTVKNYVSRLFEKLGMTRRSQAAVYGAGLGH